MADVTRNRRHTLHNQMWFWATATVGLFVSLECRAELIFQQGSKYQHIRDYCLKTAAIIKISKCFIQNLTNRTVVVLGTLHSSNNDFTKTTVTFLCCWGSDLFSFARNVLTHSWQIRFAFLARGHRGSVSRSLSPCRLCLSLMVLYSPL